MRIFEKYSAKNPPRLRKFAIEKQRETQLQAWRIKSFNIYEPARVPGWNYFGYSWTEPKPSFVFRKPMTAMVDLTNDLGVAILQDYSYSRSNFAFSPYGVASVLVVLYEGARGESARQIHRAVRFPWDRDIIRIGFRDIHRHLRSYFSHEGYLSGITLSKEGSSLKPEYKRILRFYGYDVDMDSNEKPTESDPVEPTEEVLPSSPTSSTVDTGITTNEMTTMKGNDITADSEIPTMDTTIAVTPTIFQGNVTLSNDETLSTLTAIEDKESPFTLSINDMVSSTTTVTSMTGTPEITDTLPTAAEETVTERQTLTPTIITTSESSTGYTTMAAVDQQTSIMILDNKTTSSLAIADQETTTSTRLLDQETTTSSPILDQETTTSTRLLDQETSTLATIQDQETTTSTSISNQGSTTSTSILDQETTTSATIQDQEATTSTSISNQGSTTSTSILDQETTTSATIQDQETTTSETIMNSGTTSSAEELVENLGTMSTILDQLAAMKEPEIFGNTVQDRHQKLNQRELDNGMLIPQPDSVWTSPDIRTPSELFPSLPEKRDLIGSEGRNESSSDGWKEIGLTLIAEGDRIRLERKTLDEFLSTLMNSVKNITKRTISDKQRAPLGNGRYFSSEKSRPMENRRKTAIKQELLDFGTTALLKRKHTTKEKRTISEFLKIPAVTDLSLQLQNGMFDSHVSKDMDLYRALPQFMFLVDGAIDTPVPMMSYTNIFPFAYIPRLHCKALEFPLDDERYKLLILLPIERRGLRQLIYDLGTYPLRRIIDVLRPTRVQAMVPTFMVEGFVILTPTLQKLGIWDVFDPRRSDLSGMTRDPDLYVRNIEQSVTVVIRNYVEILDIQTRTMAARLIDEDFTASHPFLYFVMDTDTNVALMAGQMLDPLNSRIY